MLLFRAMNDLDMTIDPIKNGLASKELIYNATKRYLYNTDRETMEKLSIKDRDEYIKSYMNKYLLDHKYKLSKIFRKDHKPVRDRIHKFVEEKDPFAYCELLKDLSSLPNHLVNGSRTYTNWISSTSEFDCVWRYYDRQKVHNVAVLDVYTNGVFDEDTYVIDLSNRKTIENIEFLSNKIDDDTFNSFIKFIEENPAYKDHIPAAFEKFVMRPTNKRFMGFNFAAASKEHSIFEHIPKESVVSVLESLQIDLVCADMLNEEYYKLNQRQQIQELNRLKELILKHVKEENNPYMLYVFDELYLKKHNIAEITSTPEEEQKMIAMRNKILYKSQRLPSVLIKRRI
ncbi:MAG: hypothetical protein IJH20_05060 [Bacilli bacterium]|nr:hypothetical protein [Bacilli bacterium]